MENSITNENSKTNFQPLGDGGIEGNSASSPELPANSEPARTYTEEEVQRLIDSKISIAYSKWEKQQNKAVREAERLASLSEEERNKEKIKALEETLSQKEKALAIRENTITLKDEMSKRNIPTELSGFLVSEDADEMFNNLQIFDKALKALVNREVEKRLSSTSPKGGNIIDTNAMTREKFKKMSLAEQQNLYNTDKELYNSLTS